MVFPTDEVTLTMLREACRIQHDGRSHLYDFLNMGARAAETVHHVDYDEVVYEAGMAPWSVQQVVVALVNEIEVLRG